MPHPKPQPGDLPSGWSRVGLQIPDSLADELAQARQRLPGQLSKLVGTAAIATFVALPHDIQLMLYRWAHFNELEPDKAHSQEALTIVMEMMRRHTAAAHNIRPMHSAEREVIARVLKVLGDRDPNDHMQVVVQSLGMADREGQEQLRREIEEGLDWAEKQKLSEHAQRMVDHLKQRPLPTEQTHEVTRILDPGILGKKKAKKEDAA